MWVLRVLTLVVRRAGGSDGGPSPGVALRVLHQNAAPVKAGCSVLSRAYRRAMTQPARRRNWPIRQLSALARRAPRATSIWHSFCYVTLRVEAVSAARFAGGAGLLLLRPHGRTPRLRVLVHARQGSTGERTTAMHHAVPLVRFSPPVPTGRMPSPRFPLLRSPAGRFCSRRHSRALPMEFTL